MTKLFLKILLNKKNDASFNYQYRVNIIKQNDRDCRFIGVVPVEILCI